MNKILQQEIIDCHKRNGYCLKTIVMLLFFILNFNTSFGQAGAALAFDGSNDYVTCGNILPTTYTKEAWFLVTNLGLNNNLISGGADGQHALYPPAVYGNRLSAGHNGTWNAVQDPTPIVANTWYHVALTYDAATTTMKLYKNGVLVSINSNVAPIVGGNAVRLGAFDNGQNLLGGKMDEVRIWGRVLTECEIQNNMNAELSIPQSGGLVAYYKFNQGTASGTNTGINTLIDSSFNNNFTGTLNNFALTVFSPGSNWTAPGGVSTGSSSAVFSLLSVATTQTLCASTGATVANLTATGTAIKWYNVASGGTALVSTTALSTATYYVTQTTGTCESPRTAVAVTVNNTTVPTTTATQTFNAISSVSNLTATGSSIKWYNVASGGTALLSTTVLTTRLYYVTQTLNSCESARVAVQVNINGAGLAFDGSNDYGIINNTIPATDNKTYEAWVYPTNLTGFRTILNHTNWETGAIHFQFSNNELHFDFNFTNYACTFPFTINSWYHVAAVYSKANATIQFYVNGNLINTVAVLTTATVPSSARIELGGWEGGRYFAGNIDEVRIWNRALTQCEIQNNRGAELPTGQSSLVAYYKFNQGIASGTNTGINTLIDSSGNTYTGALTNFALTGTSSNWIAPSIVATGTTSPAFSLLSVATTQTLCASTGATVANLTATGTAIKWYNVASGGTALVSTTALSTATYFVTQTTGTCESPRTAVAVTVNNTAVPTTTTTQTFSTGATVASLSATGTLLKWYNVASGGTALVSTTVLTTRLYYVTQTLNSCESTRVAVQVNINGAAVNFDGVNDYVICTNSSSLNITGSISLEAFVFRNTINTDDCIIGKDIFNTSTGYSFWIYQNNKLALRFGNREFFSTSTITSGTWAHVAGTFEAGVVKIYINGVLDATYSSVAPPVTNTNSLYIGTPQDAIANSAFAFGGNIDEVRIWNRALSQCEIQNNMSTELSTGQTGLVAYYNFNRGIASGTNTGIQTIGDSSGNGLTGALVNFALAGTTSNWTAPGGVTTGTTSPAFSLLSVATTQTFCNTATVAELTATGTTIKWYNIATGGTALVSTTALSTATYYVTQTTGTCESPRTAVSVVINPKIVATFTIANSICSGAALSALPTTSNNGITGTWSPALNNLATTAYTFTPTPGICAYNSVLTIFVNPNITPTFTAIADICSGASLSALPTTSNNGITGTWSPALNNTFTTTYTFTPTAGLCAVTTTLTIIVNPSSDNVTTVSSCDAYVWNGTTYFVTGNYTGSTTNCVTEKLALTITPSSDNVTTVSACDAYVWNGTTYFATGNYTGSTTNCVTEKLALTITPSSENVTTVSSCDAYVWNGTTYFTTGNYTGSTTNCVTEKLALTITPSTENVTNVYFCDSYIWPNNGQIYTETGVYTGTTTNCVTEKLNLVITPTPVADNPTDVIACQYYILPALSVGNKYYSESNGQGIEYVVGANNGITQNSTIYVLAQSPFFPFCKSENSFTVTITPNNGSTTNENVCGSSYTWASNGQVYTTSGIYEYVSGCNISYLILTINPVITNVTNQNACDSYFWPDNASSYNETGTYSFNVGCETFILNLTITPSTLTLFADADNDGFGNASSSILTCVATVGYVTNSLDCNDNNANVNPNKLEVLYNGIDDNCDGNLDEGFQLTTVMPTAQCNTTLQFMHSSVYATHTPGATAARYRVKNMTTNVVQYLEKFGATTHHWFQFNTLASYEYATTYLVDVELQMNGVWLGYYGAACTINSPAFSATNPIGVASLNGANCGRTLTNLHDGINATSVSGATGYRYEVTNMNTGVLLGTIERTLPWFNLSMFATRAVYGTPYSVRIAVKTTGDYGIFGATCTINTPVAVGLNAATCGLNAVNKSTSFNTTSRTAVMVYRFKVTNQTTSSEQILDRSFTWFNFGHLTAIYAANTTFSVEVAYSTGAGVFSPYSTSCTISSNGAASIAPVVVNNPTYAKGRNATYKISNFEVSAFPNPFNENFAFDLKSSSDNQVSIQVYDMIGKLIESREINFLNINNTTIGNNYPSGVYNVIVSQNDDLKTLRVIKR